MSDAQIQRNELIPKESLDLIVAAHRRSAFDAGYSRAIADVMAVAVFVAEDALRAAPANADSRPDTRAVLYRFIASLETQTHRLASGEGVVSDGAGI